MNSELTDYLSQFITVTDELANALDQNSLIKEFKKGHTLINEGDLYKETYFVLKGCVRSFRIKDGEDITIDFYLDEQPVMPAASEDPQPADFYLECLEDSLILINTKEQEESMLIRFPVLKNLCMQLSDYLADKLQKEYSDFKTSTPEERYRKLINTKPELFTRVPQYQIASYLGIKPESLSRIKKRVNLNLDQ